MNTIRRARKRPRIASVNWRSFGWLLAVETSYQVIRQGWDRNRLEPLTRATFLELYRESYRYRAERLMRLNPRLRELP